MTLTDSELYFCQIMEAIVNNCLKQDQNDIYVKPWLFEILREHPHAGKGIPRAISKPDGSWLDDLSEDSAVSIHGKTFIRYNDTASDFVWYAWELEASQGRITEVSGRIDATDQ
jgi:hypothetical protein